MLSKICQNILGQKWRLKWYIVAKWDFIFCSLWKLKFHIAFATFQFDGHFENFVFHYFRQIFLHFRFLGKMELFNFQRFFFTWVGFKFYLLSKFSVAEITVEKVHLCVIIVPQSFVMNFKNTLFTCRFLFFIILTLFIF